MVVRVVAWVALAAWVWLALCQGGFWRTGQRLPPRRTPARWPSVAVVVPARDEADVLPSTLPSLLAQRYPGAARVILVDDGSGDGTAAVAERLAREQPGLPLTVTSPPPVPPGWTGKLWALAHGVTVAGEVDHLLLTDADIAHDPESLVALVEAAGERDLVSQMALLRTRTGWERLIVPAFVYFFAMLYPFRRVNRPRARTAAAAGGCCLVRRDALERAGGVAAIRGAIIDDVALGTAIKRSGGRIWLGLAEHARSLRPYPTLRSLWQMISRSAYTQLRHSPLLLAGTVAGLALVFLAPPALTVAGALLRDELVWAPAAAAWLVMALTFVPMLRHHRQPVAAAALLPVTATLYLLMTVDSAVRHWRGRGATWKGRSYPG
ncbi:glycosyltransferase [Amycolatopsis acidiphila]|uniref:Glycosyltransferase n=1 Tax=Amycolatopsis acidiphila TaxID=715473 RepID=A0A557ZNW4_9PSEU|nr:glycosyltransferase [Amycolatopsis acidiphila]TVT13714.1 glycosyltransferase [Amycolatopsis acidiphila]UIJ63906.1 glycosyltransferase [Amycolatopsis acidiphila]GHG66617.1 glycosyl transferase family 2 [Amycolatopsis acidiphila]